MVLLDPLGPDFVNAKITFESNAFGGGVKITKLTAVASGRTGLHLVHPLFLGVPVGQPRVPDPVDSFDGYELRVPRFQSAQVGPGLVILTNISMQVPMFSLGFASLTRYCGVRLVAGCAARLMFTQTVQPAIVAANCIMCHDGANASAKNSLDMSRMTDITMEGQEAACGQLLNSVDTGNPAISRIFQATDPAQMNTHVMFRFKFASPMAAMKFQSDITPWIQAEAPGDGGVPPDAGCM